MFHGTGDRLVNYGQVRFFNIGFFGSEKIAHRFKKLGYTYSIYRYLDCGHEIAVIMDDSTEYQFKFLEETVMNGGKTAVDKTIDDPSIVRSGSQSRKELYGGE